MISNQLSFSASLNVLLQMPMQLPVMKRELANKMYSPSAYFLGRYTSNLLLQTMYPIIMVVTIFWGIGINTSFENFRWMMAYGVISNYVFCSQGYFVGIAVDSEDGCKVVNMFIVLLFSTCNGVLANLKTANWFILGISWVSPARFGVEGFFRRCTQQLNDQFFSLPNGATI